MCPDKWTQDWHVIAAAIEWLRGQPRIVSGGFLIVDDTDWFDSAVRRKLDAAVQDWDVTMRHTEKQSIIHVNVAVAPGVRHSHASPRDREGVS